MSQRQDPDGRRLPVKLDSTSNGEFTPVPLAPEHHHANALAHDQAELNARRLGVSRRGFLVSACGAASSLLAMNAAYAAAGKRGGFFQVPAEAALDLHADHRAHRQRAGHSARTEHRRTDPAQRAIQAGALPRRNRAFGLDATANVAAERITLGLELRRQVGQRQYLAALYVEHHNGTGRGAMLLRVHDVAATADALKVWNAVAAQPMPRPRTTAPSIRWPDEE